MCNTLPNTSITLMNGHIRCCDKQKGTNGLNASCHKAKWRIAKIIILVSGYLSCSIWLKKL